MIDTRVELPKKLKSRNDDQEEHLRCGGDWCDMRMQRNGKYCMHKVHRSYKYTVQRRDGVVVVVRFFVGVVVDVVVEGDSCMKKDQSVEAE
jgi:hypothetical protein